MYFYAVVRNINTPCSSPETLSNMPYTKEQLNYFRMIHIVVTIFSAALRRLFKEEWRKFCGSSWRDRRRDGRQFFLNESIRNRRRNREALKTISKGDSSHFDNSILFYCLLYSDSVGAELWNNDRSMYDEIDRLRLLRNEVCHLAPNDEVEDSDFKSFCTEAITCFRNLGLSTSELKAVKREKSFNTDEVIKLKEKLAREQMIIGEYEQYFSNKFAKLRTFSSKFNPRPYLSKMKDLGILTGDEVEIIQKQKRRKIELAILLDSVVYKGIDTVSAFLDLLNETDTEAASSFMHFLVPSEQFEERRNSSPEMIPRATSKYPKHYKLVMRTFTNDIFNRDWETLKRRSVVFLHHCQDWATKLFVQIELAYGYNIQGDSVKALSLLNHTIANAWKAKDNCPLILARALARKSLQFVYDKKYSESSALAEEANMIVSTMESPEEQIVCQKRIADCILYEDSSLKNKKERITPLWNAIIESCRRNIDSVPRSAFYLRFVFADKARLHLGFSMNGFHPDPSNASDLQEAEHCIQRLEEPDLKTVTEATYTDAFRLICKSKIAFDQSKLTGFETEAERRKMEALSLYDEAAVICETANNNGVLFMLSSLKEYLESDNKGPRIERQK